MKELHLLRSEPSERTRELMDLLSIEKGNRTVARFDSEINYDLLVNLVFAADRTIIWW